MNVYPNISYIAKLIAEPTRAIILDCLMNNQALPASELAYMAKVSHPTISSHLSKLVEGIYLQLNNMVDIVTIDLLIKKLQKCLKVRDNCTNSSSSLFKTIKPTKTNSLCSNLLHHLAGKLGVEITEKLLDRQFIILEDGEYIVTEQGKQWFLNFGINVDEADTKRRVFAKPCLDWSERRYHIAGWLGSQ